MNEISRRTPVEELPERLTVDEFRCFWDIAKSTAYDLVKKEKIKSVRVGRRVFVLKQAILDMVKE